MIIKYIGHACFRVESDGYSIVIDPYEAGSIPGLAPLDETANMAIASHDHFDHAALGEVRIEGSNRCPFTISSIETYHDECHGAKRGGNRITIIDDGKHRIAHFGDLGCDASKELSSDELAMITELDAAIIPVGGMYTIDAAGALSLMKAIRPKHVIPMHFRDPEGRYGLDDLATFESFTSLLDDYVMTESSVYDTDSEHVSVVNVLVPANIR